MSGAGAGAGVSNYAAAKAHVMQGVMASLMARTEAEIAEEITEMMESGVIEEDRGIFTCTLCKQPLENGFPCPYCGASGMEKEIDISPDDEDDAEEPVHSERETLFEELSEVRDLAEHIEELLSQFGCQENEAVEGSQIIAFILEDKKPADIVEYISGVDSFKNISDHIRGILRDKVLAEAVLEECQNMADEAEDIKRVEYPVRICKGANGKWMVSVDSPARNIDIRNPGAMITVGGYSIRVDKRLQQISKKVDNLKKVIMAFVMSDKGKDFLGATSREDAAKILKERALQQKDIAQDVGIPESTLSRWCSDGASVVSTPHGPFALKELFGRSSVGTEYTTHGVAERARYKLASGELKKLRTELEKKEGIRISERMLRYLLSGKSEDKSEE